MISESDLQAVLARVGGRISRIDFQSEEIPLHLMGSAMPSAVAGRISVDVEISFSDRSGCIEFFSDIAKVQDLHNKEKKIKQLHDTYPTLKGAYEQYQLLLKLYQ